MLLALDEYHSDSYVRQGHFDEEDIDENEEIEDMVDDEENFYQDQLLSQGHTHVSYDTVERLALDRLGMEENRYNIMIYKDTGLGVYNTVKDIQTCTDEEYRTKLDANGDISTLNRTKRVLSDKIIKCVNDKRKYPTLDSVIDKLWDIKGKLNWDIILNYLEQLPLETDDDELYLKYYIL
jgi:hypothetical protein